MNNSIPKIEDIEKENKEILSNGVKFSFTITYILLLTTATITFIEAMRTKNSLVRHILNLETCISIVAAYFYSVFITKLDESEKNKIKLNWKNISETRYVDWSITTPMMLLTLCLVLSYNSKTTIHLSIMISILLLNYMMLILGYSGEMKYIDKTIANIIGFIPFFSMFFIIYLYYVKPRPTRDNYIIFGIYLTIWSIYGIVYMFDEMTKNIIINILDLTAKCLVGIGLWIYYTKTIKL
jgi:bacteriorhodopsin